MRPTATTETFGRTLLIALCAIVFIACGDTPQENDPDGSQANSQSESNTGAKVIPAKYLAKTMAVRDGDGWRILVTLPASLPNGAQVAQVTCQTSEETHSSTESANRMQLSFDLKDETSGYEVVITASSGETFVTKATFK